LKIKKSRLAALLIAYPLLVKAFLIAILILIIIVAAVVTIAIHYLKKSDQQINPPQTNNVAVVLKGIWWDYLNPTNPVIPFFDWNRAETNIPAISPMVDGPLPVTNQCPGHVLQYGYASSSNNTFGLWMQIDAGIGPNMNPLETNGLLQTFLDDGTNFDGIIAIPNDFMLITIQANPSNAVSFGYSPLVHYSEINGITNMVALNFVIDRGDTIQSMTPFYTNRACYLDAVNMLIDSNSFPDWGFYRVRLQDGISDSEMQTNSTYWGN